MASTNQASLILTQSPEVRAHILSFLLLDLSVIDSDACWSPCAQNPPRYTDPGEWEPYYSGSAYNFRADGEACHTGILWVNKKFYNDGVKYLYRQKTFKFSVFDFGFDYLNEPAN